MLSTSLPLDVRGFLEGGEALLMVIGKCCMILTMPMSTEFVVGVS